MSPGADRFKAAAEELVAEMESVMSRQLRLLAIAEEKGANVGSMRDALHEVRRSVESTMASVLRIQSEFDHILETLDRLERRWLPKK